MKAKVLIAVLMGLCLVLTLSLPAAAQEKGAAKKDEDRVSGTIQNMNKATMTLTVRTRDGIMRPVVYSAETKITNNNKPGGSADEFKEGVRVICLGKYNDKNQLVATRIDIRPPR
jgi:hypothetical protein